MRLVTCMGGVYRISERNYRKLLRTAAANQDYDLDKVAKFIGYIELDFTDLSPRDAAAFIASLEADA